MNVLFTGKGTSGSWKIRGEQLGKAVGGTVVKDADPKTMSQHNAIFFVKRVSDFHYERLRKAVVPWIWDVVDAWPQPGGNSWGRERALEWLRMELRRLRPDGVVFPTRAMEEDADWYTPSLVLPHHANTEYVRATRPVSEKIRVVGYEGSFHYLGKWLPTLEKECSKRGWQLNIGTRLFDADVVVALRDTTGYTSPAWKSNVKLANAHALGVPAVCCVEKGYVEFSAGTERWVTEPKDLSEAFDELEPHEFRVSLRERMLASVIPVERVAAKLSEWMRQCRFC